MKKSTLFCVASIGLLSTTVLGAHIVSADETGDSATSTAKIVFTGDNTDPNTPVDPNNPDNPDNPDNPVDPDDPNNHGTGDNGPLSLDYVSNITFGTKQVSAGDEVYHALNSDARVQVTDKRGVEGGWTLTAAASKFVADDKSELKGAVLSFQNGEVKTTSDNQSAAPTASNFTFDNDEAKAVMTAESLAGQGLWLDVFNGTEGDNANIQLSVPAGSAEAKEYTATITWTLEATPAS